MKKQPQHLEQHLQPQLLSKNLKVRILAIFFISWNFLEKLTLFYFCLAIIITGGDPSSSYRSVEILRSNGSYWCSLPNLPDDRHEGHTQSGLITCGGYDPSDTQTSCLSFTDGQWSTSHQLQHRRYRHSTWMSQHGVVLLGGGGSTSTTEILTDNEGSTPAFTLKSETL